MESYTALNQSDDESRKEASGLELESRYPRSSCSWFAAGFCAALAMTVLFTVLYQAINNRGKKHGLIPDCKLQSTIVKRISHNVQFPMLRLNSDLIRNSPT
jgi:hypothetical protein